MPKTKLKEVLRSDDSKKEKISYLWEYYKWHSIITLFILLVAGYSVYEFRNRPNITFQITVLSEQIDITEEEPMNQELNDFLNLDDDPGEALMSFTQTGITTERFIAQWTAAEYDIILFDEEQFNLYSDQGTMQEFNVVSGVEDEDSIIVHSAYENPMAIAASEFPLFDEYNTTRDLYVVIPMNTENPVQVREFFRLQGIEIEFMQEES